MRMKVCNIGKNSENAEIAGERKFRSQKTRINLEDFVFSKIKKFFSLGGSQSSTGPIFHLQTKTDLFLIFYKFVKL